MNNDRDVFFDENYARLYENIEGGTVEAFEYNADGVSIKNIYLKRAVPWLIDGVQYYDAITPYGFGGAFIQSGEASEGSVSAYYMAWSEYCRENRIIADFVRFHLYSGFIAGFPGEIVKVSDNVTLDLTASLDSIWRQFEHKVRKNVKRAQSLALTVRISEDAGELEAFMRIYYATLKRNSARAYYYFDRTYFERLIAALSGSFAFFTVYAGDTPVSAELVLASGSYVYSFLGGTLEEYFPMRPNELLKWEIIKWGKRTGRRVFILGGGYGANDGIFKYKKAFSPNSLTPFYVGRAVLDESVYAALVAQRRKQSEPDGGYFPLYRG